ncbi:MAG: hypothetical protein ACD_12C00679G0001 [uncultured bacterium]|nr:MAG: hypothetical protein ACD_12C00679G0001 [uncultured bacterium]
MNFTPFSFALLYKASDNLFNSCLFGFTKSRKLISKALPDPAISSNNSSKQVGSAFISSSTLGGSSRIKWFNISTTSLLITVW